MIMLERWSVSWRENGCYRGSQFNGKRMIMLEVVSLMEGEWLCYGGG